MAAAAAAPAAVGGLEGNKEWMDEEDLKLVDALVAEGQAHLLADWPAPGESDDGKRRLLAQLRHLDKSYAGGLVKYIRNARQLLKDSKEGVNPFEGCTPAVPEGEKLDFGSQHFRELERAGIAAAGEAAIVLVAGGLGERLGYSGIKVALPVESASGMCFLELYVKSILALGAKAGRALPLAIMTSDDTHQRTVDLLEKHSYWGAAPGQITLIKQEKVACLADNDARLALLPNDPFQVQTKPHGHGDVHMLLHSSGLADKWLADGFKWVCFFQDTNGLVFRALPAAIGVSVANDYDVNSLAVPRRAKEAIGAITRLTYPDGRHITINVEYNQLDPLLRATIAPEGDVNDDTGFSPFPGNINQLVLKLSTYCAELHRHGGVIAEFVNPKYADASKDKFKSSTRLECMMQDFPKSLPEGCRVGFTVVNQVWAAYSPVKNSPADAAAKAAGGNPSHSATTGELDMYMTNCKMLQALGARIDGPQPAEFNGIKDLELWPCVAWSPLWACSWDDVEAKVTASKLHIGADAALVIEAPDAQIRSLDLQRGALVIKAAAGSQEAAAAGTDSTGSAAAAEAGAAAGAAAAGAPVVVDGLTVDNAGWEWQPLDPDAGAAEEQYIRGFRVVRHDQLVLP
ncbi:UDP-sugar pyrophosphorylase 1 [Chlorella sorokiniana]|uniref:UTP-monosaccharide-1-phosphate uridylyltransferase n=1 Tax=Chlorella sorokiniana TaxID=3076 RepID=A0A2P6TLI6_CHLSO|nr:UDP-sugar pyrophosphorylase 1 [Chlorella sorokiniana]|eukprot:PRW45148.1 UDP-sugar pyrophosphorylase 1 [Chlorella sorokiniana]